MLSSGLQSLSAVSGPVSPCWHPLHQFALPCDHCQAQPFAPTASGATDWRDRRHGSRGRSDRSGSGRCRGPRWSQNGWDKKRTDGMMVVDLDEARKLKDLSLRMFKIVHDMSMIFHQH